MTDIAVAILSALVGFLVWIVQRHFERLAAERLRREELYGTLLSASAEFIGTKNGAPFIIESQRAWLYASDDVLKKINDYLKAFLAEGEAQGSAMNDSEEWAAVLKAEGRLRLAIRKDLSPNSVITDRWVSEEWNHATSHPER